MTKPNPIEPDGPFFPELHERWDHYNARDLAFEDLRGAGLLLDRYRVVQKNLSPFSQAGFPELRIPVREYALLVNDTIELLESLILLMPELDGE